MSRAAEAPVENRYQYRLLATSKTSTMQKELQEAADAGFDYRGQTVFKSAFGGEEVVVILEKDLDEESTYYAYKLIATKKTSTLQKELIEAGIEGYEFVGFTVSKSRFGGAEFRCYYNFVRPHGALKFGRESRTPAMQAGLTTRRLTFRDIFLATTIPLWSRIKVFLLTGARNPVSSAPVPLPEAA